MYFYDTFFPLTLEKKDLQSRTSLYFIMFGFNFNQFMKTDVIMLQFYQNTAGKDGRLCIDYSTAVPFVLVASNSESAGGGNATPLDLTPASTPFATILGG